jgi:transcription elongation factor Elf1
MTLPFFSQVLALSLRVRFLSHAPFATCSNCGRFLEVNLNGAVYGVTVFGTFFFHANASLKV